MVTVYLDESTVNAGTNSPVAVVAGLILKQEDAFWIDAALQRTVSTYLPQNVLHMKDFGAHGKLKWVTPDTKRQLFRDVATVIRRHKFISIQSTLSHQDYLAALGGFGKHIKLFSIHGLCLLQAMVGIGKWADAHRCTYQIPYILDDGCPDRKVLAAMHEETKEVFQLDYPVHVGPLEWGDDERLPALQAADAVAWAARRKEAGEPFLDGYEPLLDIFEERHLSFHYERAWMEELEQAVRERMKTE